MYRKPPEETQEPATIEPIERPPLTEMDAQELCAWLAMHQAELESFCSFAQSYTKRREREGHVTRTDARYSQFFTHAQDLIAGLVEMQTYAQEASQEQDEHQDHQEEEDTHERQDH
jgi:hypothetical protein